MKTGMAPNKDLSLAETTGVLPADASVYLQQAKKYQAMLSSIAFTLGLEETEAEALAETTCLLGSKCFAGQTEGLSLRMWLSKLLVRSAVFQISSVLFANSGRTATSSPLPGCRLHSSIRKLPFSFQTVYVLVRKCGFTEPEVARLLNISPLQVKERLAKATLRMFAS